MFPLIIPLNQSNFRRFIANLHNCTPFRRIDGVGQTIPGYSLTALILFNFPCNQTYTSQSVNQIVIIKYTLVEARKLAVSNRNVKTYAVTPRVLIRPPSFVITSLDYSRLMIMVILPFAIM